MGVAAGRSSAQQLEHRQQAERGPRQAIAQHRRSGPLQDAQAHKGYPYRKPGAPFKDSREGAGLQTQRVAEAGQKYESGKKLGKHVALAVERERSSCRGIVLYWRMQCCCLRRRRYGGLVAEPGVDEFLPVGGLGALAYQTRDARPYTRSYSGG